MQINNNNSELWNTVTVEKRFGHFYAVCALLLEHRPIFQLPPYYLFRIFLYPQKYVFHRLDFFRRVTQTP